MAPKQDDDNERERPSWREIDQRRDRAGQQGPARPRPSKKQAEKERQLALSQAEALFKGKRALPEYKTALRQLEGHHGTKKFAQTVKKFLEEYGLPAEWGALNLLLDYPEATVVGQVLQAMAAQAGSHTRVEQQGFKAKLQVLALTHPQVELRRQAEDILAEMLDSGQ